MFCCSQCGRKLVTNQDWLKLPQFPTAPPSIEPLCGSMSTYPLAQGRHTRANFQCAMLTWFTANSLFRHRALPLRIQVNQSLSRFSLTIQCAANNAGRCSKAPKETLSSLRIQVNQTFSHFFFVRARRKEKVIKKKRRFSGHCPDPVMFGA